jgi:peptidoglycan/xylan/chitin deacetylase (PgdA/CDA1 family)
MNVLSLVYHDVVEPNQEDSSGFPGQEAARYKVQKTVFDQHLSAIQRALGDGVIDTLPLRNDGKRHVFLTFDDGGISAFTYIADALERRGWRGHFLITTGCIGLPGFMGAAQITDLRRRGHAIGSHSWRHPVRMAACSWDVLLEEWNTSIKTLNDLLGEQVTIAAVPGGLFSTKVGRAAAAAGIRYLFTSHTTVHPIRIHSCEVLGRYPILGTTRSSVAGGLATGSRRTRLAQQAIWRPKHMLRYFGAPYDLLRRSILRTGDAELSGDLISQLRRPTGTDPSPHSNS